MKSIEKFIKWQDKRLSVQVNLLDNAKVTMLLLHGAGQASKDRFNGLIGELNKNGIQTVTFDFVGHGKSTGDLKGSSLQDRYDQAVTVIDWFEQAYNYKINSLIGFSMSGETSIQLAAKRLKYVKALILFCPAVYDRKAYKVPFGPEFSQLIRRNKSYLNSEALELMKNIKARKVIFYGTEDNVIPPEIIDILHRNGSTEVVYLKGLPHQLAKWMSNHPAARHLVVNKILHILSINVK